jgi:hypothetical protein
MAISFSIFQHGSPFWQLTPASKYAVCYLEFLSVKNKYEYKKRLGNAQPVLCSSLINILFNYKRSPRDSWICIYYFLLLVGWDFWYCGHYWPIVPAPGDRWWWRNWLNEDWQGKPKHSKKTCPSATLSTTNPTRLDPGLNTIYINLSLREYY